MEAYFNSGARTNGSYRSLWVAAWPLVGWSNSAVHSSCGPDPVFRPAWPHRNHRDQDVVSRFERRQRMVCGDYYINLIDNRVGVYGDNVYQKATMGDGSFCGARAVQPVVGLSSKL